MQKQIQKVPPCIWKYTRLFGFSHTCVVFAKHLEKSQVFGKNHTCVGSNVVRFFSLQKSIHFVRKKIVFGMETDGFIKLLHFRPVLPS